MNRLRVLGVVLVLVLSVGLLPAVPARSQISLEEVEARSVEYTVEILPVPTPVIPPPPVRQPLAPEPGPPRTLPTGTLQGRATLVFEVTAPYNVSTVRLFFFVGLRSVRAEGHEVRAARSGSDLTLTFPTALRPGTRVTLQIEFAGPTFPVWNDYTWVGVGEIYPSLISPFGDFNQNRASIRGTVTAPEWMTIVSAGALVNTSAANGKRVWRFESEADAERTVVLGGRYVKRTLEGGPVPIDVYTVAGADANVSAIADMLTKSYAFQTQYIGPLPYKRITIATFPSYWEGPFLLGVAYPGILMLNDLDLAGRRQPPLNRQSFIFSTVAHELAHGYFGMEVQGKGAGWQCIWECFAEYVGLRTLQAVLGERAFQTELDEHRGDYNLVIGIDRPITAYTFINSGGGVAAIVRYSKGALVLHMLRYVLGEAKFQQFLSSLVRENRHKAIRIETVQEYAERALGEPLNWFFQQWFYQVVVPDYQIVAANSVAEGSGFRTTATVRNAGVGTMPVEVGFVQENNEIVTGRVTVGTREEKTVTVPTDRRVTRVIADPGRWLLQSNYRNDEAAVR